MSENPYPMNDTEQAWLAEEERARGMKLPEMQNLSLNGMCFGCGVKNAEGLHMHFFHIPGGALSFFTPTHAQQSYLDRMHGGLVMTMMDEIMGNYLWIKEGAPTYTGKMESRFRNPVIVGETVKISCQEVKRKGPLVVMEARVERHDGTICAEATSHMMVEKKAMKGLLHAVEAEKKP